jgi:hypothetical protein
MSGKRFQAAIAEIALQSSTGDDFKRIGLAPAG